MKADPTTTKLLVAAFATAAAFAWTGCHSHEEGETHAPDAGAHSSPYPACNDITTSCHSVDFGEGPIHDCHDAAHAAKSEADCTSIKDSCLQLCAAAKVDGGAADGG